MRARALPLLLLALPLLAACGGEGSEECPTGQVRSGDQCVEPGACTPGALRCDGLRAAEACNAEGTGWAAADTCGLEELCREGTCLATFACEDETPACCATMAQCGDVLQPDDCPECLAISRTGWCDTGACRGPEGTSTSLHVVADGRDLAAATADAVQSAVTTVYHAYAADGGTLGCAELLEGGTESRHDVKDPLLNPVYSQALAVQNVGGTDQFEMRPGAVPVGTDALVVVTVYDQTGGGGAALARGCVDGLDTTSQTQIAVPLGAF